MAGGRAVSNAAKIVSIRPRCCSYCGQSLPETRMGVRFTPLKARIFDVVMRAGPDGISARDLFGIVYENGEKSRATLKAHVWQINDAITQAGYRIGGYDGFYRLTKC